MKIGNKFILASLGAVTAATIVGLIVQRSIIRQQGVDLVSNQMRSVILQAENTRDSFSALNQAHAFAKEQLLEELAQSDDYRETTIYATVPVVAAWKGLEKVAEEEDFAFRVVRDNPRNPKNAPDAYERRILERFAQGEKSFFELDKKNDRMVYARPIVLSADCLACHGDPATSPTGNGRDVLGFKMENWNTGDVRGAFVLSSTMERVDEVVAASFGQTLLWLFPVVVLIIIGMSWIVKRAVVRPLEAAIKVIDTSSSEAESATSEISKASNSLAQGACEQAASLEETSASLEQISETSRKNATSARHVSDIATQAADAAHESGSRMDEMQQAMSNINDSSEKVSAIIKTIDEIAFQTNILALNAAVEAARAGEAGAGFAVVADEVRSLAGRAGDAARQTASLIEESGESTSHGNEICNRVRESLDVIGQRVDEVNKLISDVVNASEEQDNGVQQVTQAVRQMDEVTQANAASAEETASASTEVSIQAQNLRKAVGVLYEMAHGHPQAPQRKESPRPPQNSANGDSPGANRLRQAAPVHFEHN